MYQRDFNPPSRSYFLFGPRGTGKSTWLRNTYPDAHRIDLLPASQFLRFERSPTEFTAEVLARPKQQVIVVDEVQKAPSLLDEVHALIENHGYKNFVLTGSSARKLKRGGANLLAGRAVTKNFFPLTSHETEYAIDPRQIMAFGNLPLSVTASSDTERREFLESYVTTYLSEEVKSESLVRNIGSFSRFLEVAALAAGTALNVSNISRETGVGRDSVRNYFSIFEDTLLGSWLPAYRPRAKIKEVASPKFYWFDPGVLNAAAGGFKQPLPSEWHGILLEHWIHHELLAYMNYRAIRGQLGYWGTPSDSEIDFIHWYGKSVTAIEVKASTRFRTEHLRGIRSFSEAVKLRASWVVYLGEEELRSGETRVLPVRTFLKLLHAGKVFDGQ